MDTYTKDQRGDLVQKRRFIHAFTVDQTPALYLFAGSSGARPLDAQRQCFLGGNGVR